LLPRKKASLNEATLEVLEESFLHTVVEMSNGQIVLCRHRLVRHASGAGLQGISRYLYRCQFCFFCVFLQRKERP